MARSITIQLPDESGEALDELSRREQRSAEELAINLVERGLRVRRFRELRKETLERLGRDAPRDDQAALDEIS